MFEIDMWLPYHKGTYQGEHMNVVKKAVLKSSKGNAMLVLIKQADGYVWVDGVSGKRWDEAVHVDPPAAIAHLRVKIDTDPAAVGIDLTILPVAPPAVERAAERIADMRFDQSNREDIKVMVEEIIEQETDVTALLDDVQVLLAYLFRCAVPYVDPATRKMGMVSLVQGDLALRGLMLPVVESCERALKEDLSGLKGRLTAPVDRIVLAQSQPKGAVN